MRALIATLLFVAAAPAMATDDTLRFDTVVSHSGEVVANQSLTIGFGHEAVIEIPGTVRIVALASAPTGNHSHVSAKFYAFKAGAWVLDWESAMEADIGKTPSFEWDLSSAPYHVVLMPRASSK